MALAERKIVDLADQSKINNFCIDGIDEKENETRDEWEQEVQSRTGITERAMGKSKKT